MTASGWFATGALVGAFGVGIGAFGAHALERPAATKAIFETGARYQMYHAVALLAVGWAATRWPSAWIQSSGWLFLAGTSIFSGSLYLLTLSGARWLGAITPIGGLALIAGWVTLAVGALRGSG